MVGRFSLIKFILYLAKIYVVGTLIILRVLNKLEIIRTLFSEVSLPLIKNIRFKVNIRTVT